MTEHRETDIGSHVSDSGAWPTWYPSVRHGPGERSGARRKTPAPAVDVGSLKAVGPVSGRVLEASRVASSGSCLGSQGLTRAPRGYGCRQGFRACPVG